MVNSRKGIKILTILFLVVFILTSNVAVAMAVTEPNPEGFRAGDLVSIAVRSGSQYETYGYTCCGNWDVKVNGASKGECLYFQQLDIYKGMNTIHDSKVGEWVKEFNGSTEYVNSNVQNFYNKVYPLESGGPTNRVHIRDLAELCGMSYANNIAWKPGSTAWQPGEVNVFPTKYPGTYLNVPATANPGATVKWQIGGESFVKSEDSARRDKIAYTLKQNGKVLATKDVMTTKFSSSGTVTLPSNAKPGDTFKFELAVSDGVGRISNITKTVLIPGVGVQPPPSEPPEQPDPPEPPAPPNYEPVADFFIDGAPTIEGEQVRFRDHSKHPGAKYGESIVSYEWKIQGLPGASGKTATATWDKVGTYRVTLTVEDQDGDSDSCTQSVVVGPALPAAQINMSSEAIILGREVHINGDGSTAARNRDIKWNEMQWEIYNPSGRLVPYTTKSSHLFKDEKNLTNSTLNQTGMWKFRLKVKDTENNESEWTERTLQVFPDQPPKADFWLINEALRNSYKGYELTIYDQSEPGAPDGSLGDEITQRNWVLYYDANNNGSFTDSVDEVIYPGQTGKAASLTKQSNNDINPKIRFNKTGRYKVELAVTESYSAWGETCTGQSDNTLDKPAAEKEIVVVNLAPTVAFDIKKKMPVDVLFATDYTISDSKYSSLQSGQAGFTNQLISGFVEPTTEVQRVKKGQLNIQSNALISPGSGFYFDGYFNGFHATTDPNWYNFERGFGNPREINYAPYKWNISTGEVVSGHLGIPQANSFIYYGDQSTESLTGYSYTGNLNIVAERGKLSVYRGSTLLDSVNVPRTNIQDYRTGPKGRTITYHDSPVLIAPWKDGKTVVAYQNIIATSYDNWNDYLYLYLISNTTGKVIYNHTYSGLIYHYLDNCCSDRLGFSTYDVRLLMDNTIGINTTICEENHKPGDDETYYYKASVITPSLQQRDHGTVINSSYNDYGHIKVTWFNQNMYQEIRRRGTNRNNVSYTTALYNKSGYGGRLPADDMICFTMLEDGSFAYNTTEYDRRNDKYNGTLQYYSADNVYKWSKSYEHSYEYAGHLRIPSYAGNSCRGAKFMDKYIILLSGGNDKPYNDTYIIPGSRKVDISYSSTAGFMLADADTGAIITEIPYTYYGNDNKYIFCQTGVSANGEFVLACIGQLQGLNYLKQAINNHTWDGNKMNFIVSVIDGSFPDFAACKAEIEQALRDNHVKFTSISPAEAKAQTEELVKNGEGGFWVPTASTMPGPLTELANKIIAMVNEERGADCVVLVNQEVDLTSKYDDAENDPAAQMEWRFRQNPNKLGDLDISNSMGYSTINGKTLSIPPKSFDKAGSYYVNCRAKDNPVTNAEYLTHYKAGQKWSGSDAELTVLVHRKPIAAFTMSSSTTMNGTGLAISDTSYDPDLVNTDPEGKKGIRVWQWQYRPAGGDWISSGEAPRTFPSQGTFQVRLRVQDYHGAWSNWTDIKTLTVRNTPPIASFSAYPNPVQKGTNCVLTDHSMDPDGDKIVNYEWNIQGIGTRTYTNPNPFPVAWANTGNYVVTLRVQDSQGAWSAPFSQTIEIIDNKKPVAVLSLPAEGYADEEFIANGTGSYDPDPGDRVQMAYWQYKKPGQSEWSVYTTQRYGESGFLKMNFLPTDAELGIWTVKLVVEDTHGFKSDPVIKTITIKEGWQITGQIIPEVGERGRYMIVAAYAHRKDKPNEKYQIDNMKAELAYLDKACMQSGRAQAEKIEILNMPYDNSKADFRVKYLVGEKIYVTNRWPADGTYYIKITGQKGTTCKEIALPFGIKGNIWERFYIRTYSW